MNGTVDSIWPPDLGEYFNSQGLQKIKGSKNYVGYTVVFPGSAESRCLTVRDYVYPNSTGDEAYVRLNISQTSIHSGDFFEIWQTAYGCVFAG
jgi:hypothetical protein